MYQQIQISIAALTSMMHSHTLQDYNRWRQTDRTSTPLVDAYTRLPMIINLLQSLIPTQPEFINGDGI
jgi:hypothetical protein